MDEVVDLDYPLELCFSIENDWACQSNQVIEVRVVHCRGGALCAMVGSWCLREKVGDQREEAEGGEKTKGRNVNGGNGAF